MICQHCGLQNPETAVSCFQCGKLLTSVDPTHPTAASTDGPSAAVSPASSQPIMAPQPQVPPVQVQTDGKATASLVLGILSLTCFGFFAGIPAVILGHISRSNIRKSLGRLKGEGMALAGLVMGYISLALIPIVLIIAAIAIPNLLRARIVANETASVDTVRKIGNASIAYKSAKGTYPLTLDDLQQAQMIDPAMGTEVRNGYRVTYTSTGDHFLVVAVPMRVGSTGTKDFCVSEDMVIRFEKAPEECTQQSPELASSKL